MDKEPLQLRCWTALILRHPTEDKVLLLKRAGDKKLFPNLITGIGGQLEFGSGEQQDLEKSLLREFVEETKISLDSIADVQLRLSTIISRGQLQVVLLWFTGQLKEVPTNLVCNEGELAFYPIDNLPLKDFTPTAAKAIPFILSVKDNTIYNGVYIEERELIVNEVP